MANNQSDTTLRIYKYLIEHKKKNDGNSPSLRQIQAGAHISAHSLVRYHLARLEAMGLIKLGAAQEKRAIQITGAKWLPPKEPPAEKRS